MITSSELLKKYGTPTETGSPYLTKLNLPYPMVLAWDKNTTVNSIRCHKLVSERLGKVFDDILAQYGLPEIQRLGINLYGGCFNYRKMRGGNDWSRHSWGVAIDLDPERNQLHETSKTARFALPEYKAMIDIFYRHGFVSLGREKNYDWMHFEIAAGTNPLETSTPVAVLVVGSHSTEVKALQIYLSDLNYQLITDGIFGPQTKSYIEDFQRRVRIAVTGKGDPVTIIALRRASGERKEGIARLKSGGHFKKGNMGFMVTEIQTSLNKKDATLNLAINGTFDETTYIAVKTFQTKNKLGADGIVGPVTAAKLGIV